MSALTKKINDLHELLADIYRQSPYVTLDNTHTRNLWRAIEELEAGL